MSINQAIDCVGYRLMVLFCYGHQSPLEIHVAFENVLIRF